MYLFCTVFRSDEEGYLRGSTADPRLTCRGAIKQCVCVFFSGQLHSSCHQCRYCNWSWVSATTTEALQAARSRHKKQHDGGPRNGYRSWCRTRSLRAGDNWCDWRSFVLAGARTILSASGTTSRGLDLSTCLPSLRRECFQSVETCVAENEIVQQSA